MIEEHYQKVRAEIPTHVQLIAVSKTKPVENIEVLHDLGQQDFGENKVQELVEKHEKLPKSIRWHMIGHLQRNKVKYIAAFVHLIHAVDSLKLLKEIEKQGNKNNRVISCLLQVHIAEEESKFGLSEEELFTLLKSAEFQSMQNIKIHGLMGMASFTDNKDQVKGEFAHLARIFNGLKDQHEWDSLSMGMSGDYTLAIEEGSNMVRVGSAIFGARNY